MIIARRIIERREDTPEEISNLTALRDGVDIRVFQPSEDLGYFDHPNFYSFKFKKPGLRTQIITDMAGNFEWVSESTPALKHDFVHYLQQELLITREYERYSICADLGYIGDTVLNIVTPVKSPAPNSQDERFNRSINRYRSTIERSFGLVKKRFKIFKEFRSSLRNFNLLKFARALVNEIKRIENFLECHHPE